MADSGVPGIIRNAGYVRSFASLGTLVMQWPLGWISDRRDRRSAIMWSVECGVWSVGVAFAAAGAIVVYYGIGSATGRFFASLFMSAVGPGGLFLFMSMILALLLGFAGIRRIVVPYIPQIRKTAYHVYPRTTAMAFGLLRRVNRRKTRRAAPEPSAPDASEEIP